MSDQGISVEDTPPAAAPPPAPRSRAITVRAVVLALLLVTISGLLASYHDGNVTHREISMNNYIAPVLEEFKGVFHPVR